MAPIYMPRGSADGRHRELPAGPGAVQRFALRAAALASRAYGPLAI
jgi:hypothetical protein